MTGEDMTDSKSITRLMIKHHNKIEGLLNTFERDKDLDSFNRLRWEVEKHMFTEEKAVFSILPKEHDLSSAVQDLLADHKGILGLMTGEDMDTKKFRRLLTTHKNFEETAIYPRLDKDLDDHKKKLIFERIGHIK
jgi:hemerythrin superfamily protein